MKVFSGHILVIMLTLAVSMALAGLNSDSSNQSFRIEFVKSFKTADQFGPANLFAKFRDILLGSDNESLIRPVAIASFDSSRFIVLDQGLQSPVIIDYGERVFKKIPQYKDQYFPSVVGISKISDDAIIFSDSKNNQIYRYSFSSDETTLLNDTLSLKQPTGVCFVPAKQEIWVSETGNHRILVLDTNGHILRSLGNRGNENGEFNFPTHLWSGKSGKVYVSDALNFRVQVFDDTGNFLTAFGETGDASGYFSSMKGIATDSYDHIYIVDALFHTVQVFDIEGNYLYHFGTQGSNEGEFWLPNGIYIDNSDMIYVADSYNSRIQIFKLTRN